MALLAHRRKTNFRPYIGLYTSPNENFEYSYPLNNSFVKFHSKLIWEPQHGGVISKFVLTMCVIKGLHCVNWEIHGFLKINNIFYKVENIYRTYLLEILHLVLF